MKRGQVWQIFAILALAAACLWVIYPPFDIKDKDGKVIKEGKIKLGLDLQGGMHLLLKVDTSKLPASSKADAADRAIEVLRNRIDQFGVREPAIQRQGTDEIVVQLPGVTDRERAIAIIGQTAMLEFKLVADDPDKLKQAISGNVPDGYELKYSEDNEPVLLEKQAVLTGESISNALIHFDTNKFNEPGVGLEFNSEGAKKFARITGENVGRRLAIILDGKVQSAPRINEPIPSGQASITGRFTIEQAKDLSTVLRVGALPAPMSIEEERTVGPLLGQDSINKGVKATLIGITFVVVFMAVYYLLSGLISDIALILNFLIILGSMSILPYLFPGVSATLTLPGIAGIALSLGMAIDANVLINERIREELNLGRSLRMAVDHGYNRAFSAILDSHVTNLIAAVLLFQFGTGPIRGFAVTLIIGVVSSLFTAIVVTRTVLEFLMNKGWVKSLPMLHLFRNTKIDFIRSRFIFFSISMILIVVGLFTFFSKGERAYGIDFAGGELQEYMFKTQPPMDEVRKALDELKLGNAQIQQFKENPRVVLIRTAIDKNKLITDKLKQKFPDQEIQILKTEHVGPVAGQQLRAKAIYAIIGSLIGILIYIAFRFKDFNFALAGVIGIFHDVLLTLGVMAMAKIPIDLLSVTALLTIAGYSISDTIVVYDRVRENRPLNRKLSLYELINLSVNQTLSRTVLTTGVTLLTVLAIYAWGGEVLSNFSFALLVGFFLGVYSTVYITSPLVLAFQPRKKVIGK